MIPPSGIYPTWLGYYSYTNPEFTPNGQMSGGAVDMPGPERLKKIRVNVLSVYKEENINKTVDIKAKLSGIDDD